MQYQITKEILQTTQFPNQFKTTIYEIHFKRILLLNTKTSTLTMRDACKSHLTDTKYVTSTLLWEKHEGKN
jgi:hypothetical protein